MTIHLNEVYFSSLKSIRLNELNALELFNRVDKKYLLNAYQLEKFMEFIAENNYNVLSVNSLSIQQYETNYYDTPEMRFYIDHHNQRGNRIKVRTRTYKNSALSFLEVKQRKNTGEIVKRRINLANKEGSQEDPYTFVQKYTKIDPQTLSPKVLTNFNRVTFASNTFQERITLDFNLKFEHNHRWFEITDGYLVEIKKSKGLASAGANVYFKSNSIYPVNLSKYCLAIAVLSSSMKHNYFKSLLMKLNINNYKIYDELHSNTKSIWN